MSIENHVAELKKIKAELQSMTPEFKPQYGTKQKTKTLREIAEHSNFFQIEIHPNIIDELIQRERLNRANKFVEEKLAKLTAPELADLQVEVQLMLIDQELEACERRILSGVEVDVSAHDPQVISDNKFADPVGEFNPEIHGDLPETTPAPAKETKKSSGPKKGSSK